MQISTQSSSYLVKQIKGHKVHTKSLHIHFLLILVQVLKPRTESETYIVIEDFGEVYDNSHRGQPSRPPLPRVHTHTLVSMHLTNGTITGTEGCADDERMLTHGCRVLVPQPRKSPPRRRLARGLTCDIELPRRWGGRKMEPAVETHNLVATDSACARYTRGRRCRVAVPGQSHRVPFIMEQY